MFLLPTLFRRILMRSTGRTYFKTLYLLAFFFLNLLITGANAQNTNIAIGTTTLQPSVKRMGINLGTLDYYDSGQTTQNLLNQNPGFEGQIWNSTIRCASGTTTTCVDDDQWSGWPAGFWNGASFEVFYGTAAGRTGTVTSSTAPGNGVGLTLNFSSGGVAPATGDYLIVRKTVSGLASGGWWPSTSGAGVVGDNLTDLPPGTLGKQTVLLKAPGASDSASLAGYFDSVAGKTFLQLNGTFQLQFKAKGISGSNQIKLAVSRNGVSYLNQLLTLTGSWNTYNLTFTASENGSAIGTAGVSFSTIGADSFELDDVSLVKASGDPTNTTAFRDPVLTALRLLQPGVLRYWSGQLGDTLDNLLQPQFGRQRSGFLAWYTEAYQIDYGLHDFLALCQAVGTEPWFVVPSTFSTADASHLIEYLSGDISTTYGAKRAALGQGAPWTSVFSKIHLEFGNEAWNSGFKGGAIEYSAPYGGRAQTIFASMRSSPSYESSKTDLVLGGQAAWAGRNADIQNNCNNNDSFTVAPYTMGQIDSYSDNESLYGSTFAEPEAYVSSSGTAEGETPGVIYQDYQAIQSSSHPVPMSFYEINLSTVGGAISQDALNSYAPSLGAGLMVADTMLLSLRQFGVVNQELFALPQYNFMRQDGKTVPLWGSVVDMGVTDRKRPQFLALQLANQALSNGAAMVQTVHSGADPTWNQPLVNTVQMNGAHYLQSFAFSQGTNRSAVIFNLHRTTTLPVTFSGANAPGGTVQMQQLTSANPGDTNENSNVVNATSSTLGSFNPSYGLSLPPYSMTVLTWANNNPAPSISAVNVSNISGSSGTINWTTDQPSTSQVQYGATTGYGSTSALNSALSTNHSVTLTGLSSGTTYNYSVISANAAQASATSSNFVFSTSSQAPVISAVGVASISGNTATIVWTTNQPSSSQVLYGTSTSYNLNSGVNSTLTLTHSVMLTGLLSTTVYNYAVVSANSSGTSATSANFTFSTSSQTPVISAVGVNGITSTSATITWTTDQAASSLVQYGNSTGYGYSSGLNSSLVTTHSVTLSGLNAGAFYNFDVISTNSAGLSATSANLTFSTSAATSGPSIGYVSVWGITGSTATISWSTDAPSTTAVAYGLTSALGQMTPVQTLPTVSHGVLLTGLSSNTTYYFVAQSANSSGNLSYSAVYSFKTLNLSPPIISDIIVRGGSGHVAVITWTTSTPAVSWVSFGLTSAYGRWSTATPLTENPLPLMGWVPSGVIHYQLHSVDASGHEADSPDYTFVEP